MGQIDKAKFQAGIDAMNADLAKRGKTMQEAADEDKTAALDKMKTLKDDPAYAKIFNDK